MVSASLTKLPVAWPKRVNTVPGFDGICEVPEILAPASEHRVISCIEGGRSFFEAPRPPVTQSIQ